MSPTWILLVRAATLFVAQAVSCDPSHVPGLVASSVALERCDRYDAALTHSQRVLVLLRAMLQWFPRSEKQLTPALSIVCTNHLRILANSSTLRTVDGPAIVAALSAVPTQSQSAAIRRAVASAMVCNRFSRTQNRVLMVTSLLCTHVYNRFCIPCVVRTLQSPRCNVMLTQ